MAVTAPSLPIRSIQWSYSRGDNALVSGWTGAAKVIANPWNTKWRAHVDLATIQGEANAAAIKSFFARLKGQTQPFRLPATEGAQNGNSGVSVLTDAAQGATSLDLSGYTTALTVGQFVTVGGQLLCLTSDQSGNTITFQPALRKAAPAGTTAVTSRPYLLAYMASSRMGWKVSPGLLFGISFDVEEAVLEDDSIGVPEQFSLLMETGSHLLLEDSSFILLE